MVGFGLDYACAHIIILAEISSENLLPIRADFVTERDIQAKGPHTPEVWCIIAPGIRVVTQWEYSPSPFLASCGFPPWQLPLASYTSKLWVSSLATAFVLLSTIWSRRGT